MRDSIITGVIGRLPYSDNVLVLSVTIVRVENSAVADKDEPLLRLPPREACFWCRGTGWREKDMSMEGEQK